jgi:catechol 2,3-dioxygenase-like lactoylglutathione lyase family enzyme
MLDHVSIKVSDLTASTTFYRKVLAELGYDLLVELEVGCGFGPVDLKPVFWISQGTPTPSVHVCFRAAARETVDAFHRAALAAGGRDNGAPGLRPHYHPAYYAAFARDPDGYNIEAMTTAPS